MRVIISIKGKPFPRLVIDPDAPLLMRRTIEDPSCDANAYFVTDEKLKEFAPELAGLEVEIER